MFPVRTAPSMLLGAKRSPVSCPQVLRRLSRLNFEGAGPTGAITRQKHARLVHPKRQEIICRGLFADVSSLGRDHRRRPTSAQGSTWGESEHGLPSTKGRWVASSRVRYGTTVSMGCPATKDASHTGLWPGKTWPWGEGAKVLECLSSGSFWTPFW